MGKKKRLHSLASEKLGRSVWEKWSNGLGAVPIPRKESFDDHRKLTARKKKVEDLAEGVSTGSWSSEREAPALVPGSRGQNKREVSTTKIS